MTVVCGKCSTRFQLKDDQVPPAGARVRCSNCGHRFVLKPRSEPSVAPIRSLLEDDPDFLDIVQDFANQIPERIRRLDELHRQGDHEELQRLAHQLKGGAGGVGFPQISDVASALEQAVKTGAEPDLVQERLVALKQILGAVRVPGSKLESTPEWEEEAHTQGVPPEDARAEAPGRPQDPASLVAKLDEVVQRVEQIAEQLSDWNEEQRKAQGEIRGALRALLKQLPKS